MRIEETLEKFGLTGKRARAYLAALQLGEAPVSTIARQAGITRTNAYALLRKLAQEGLVTRVPKGGRTYFAAADPTRLLSLLEQRQHELLGILPDLKSVYNRSVLKPRIQYYEGLEGIRTVLHDTLECRSKQVSAILSMADLRDLPGDQEDFIARRVARGIHLRVVRSHQKETGEALWQTSEAELRELRYAPARFVFPMTTWIYDERVSLISSKRENFGLIIESPEFSYLMKDLFTLLWESSAPTNGKPAVSDASSDRARRPDTGSVDATPS